MTDYITPNCLLLRCGDRQGNLEQCAALLDEAGGDKARLKQIIRDVNRANWEERNCNNCALLIDDTCPTHGTYVEGSTWWYTYCYHRHPTETGGKRVNRRVLKRWGRFCSSRAAADVAAEWLLCARELWRLIAKWGDHEEGEW